jgi:hypothetical protein
METGLKVRGSEGTKEEEVEPETMGITGACESSH